ncbi:MAG: AAA family ATPase, partial [Saprospiraceae bacterium]|nr:AAA family ATPase [Saprospiraceae bacterium]
MIGRKQEIQKIELLLASERSEFLAVTGRRRVGKTYLVDTLLRERYCFSLTGIQNGKTQQQLTNFAVKLAEYDGSFNAKNFTKLANGFLQLKAYLITLDKTKKQIIFIDELPWVSTARSGFIQMLAHFWNDYLSKESHFLLIICGSATSWITQKIIKRQRRFTQPNHGNYSFATFQT